MNRTARTILTAFFLTAGLLLVGRGGLGTFLSIVGERLHDSAKQTLAMRVHEFALALAPADPAAWYNAGTAAGRLGEYGQAAEYLAKAAATGGREIRQRALYNQGNCLFRLGEELEWSDPAKAIARFRGAADLYGKALLLKTDDGDAVFNKRVAEGRLATLLSRKGEQERPGKASAKNPDAMQRETGSNETGERKMDTNAVPPKAGKGRESEGMDRSSKQLRSKPKPLSREEAEMLIDEARAKGTGSLMLSDKGKPARLSTVEKDW